MPEKGIQNDVFDFLLGDDAETKPKWAQDEAAQVRRKETGEERDRRDSERRWVQIEGVKSRRISESLYVSVRLVGGERQECWVSLERAINICYMKLHDIMKFFDTLEDAKRVRKAMESAVKQWRRQHDREERKQSRARVAGSHESPRRRRSGSDEGGGAAEGHPLPTESQ